ncbi:hypothetical protein Dimus_028867 [Dionaea muscipula]
MILALILEILGNNGICEYIKEKWEESTYCKPLEITRKFASDDLIAKARRLPYEDLLTRVFEAFSVPLDDREGEDPVKSDFFEETFLNMCQLKREQRGVWWLGIGANRRRDEYVKVENEQAQAENVEVNEGENLEGNFEREAVNEEGELQGEQIEKEAESAEAESGEKFDDVVEGEGTIDEVVEAPAVVDKVVEVPAAPANPDAPAIQTRVQPKGKTQTIGVDPSGSLPNIVLQHLQAEMDRALKGNSRFQELYQQLKSKPLTSPKP